ncbi:MAG: tripartite tricarboxylate transporter substrate binding protein [Burkholderiales bacterium]
MNSLMKPIAGAWFCVAAMHMPVMAQSNYPAKSVRMILPFAPGGPSDLIGRALAGKLTEQVGQPVVVDNRGGAGGNLGMELGAKAPPDGYTITLTSPTMAISPSLYRKLAFDPQKDFAPISLVANIPNIMVTHLSVPVKTLKEFIQIARNSPGKLNYGSSGAGSTTHLSSEILSNLAGLKMVHVPYKGQGLALVGLLSGQVDMMILAVPTVLPMIQSNKVRAIAALSAKRLPSVPTVPTTAESGVKDFEVSVWFGMLAPAGTSGAIVNRLNQELAKAMAAQDIRDRFAAGGIEPLTSTPEQFASFARAETVRYAKVIKDANISID